MQDISRLSSLLEITVYVKPLERKALDSRRGFQPSTALLTFCSSLDDLYNSAASVMDAINISTNVTSLSHVWMAAQRHPRFQPDQPQARQTAQALYCLSLKQLQPMMQGIGAQAISNIMSSSAKLGLNPDEFVPGVVHTLADRFQQLMPAANMTQRPNAQDAANFVWALATCNHASCSSNKQPA